MATEDLLGRKEVRGRRLLLVNDAFEISITLDLRPAKGPGPSRLRGLYRISLKSVLVLRGVMLPSMNALDCDMRLPCVGVIGFEMLDCNVGGVYELVRIKLCLLLTALSVSFDCSIVDLTSSLAMFLTSTALSDSASDSTASNKS